MRPRRTRRLPRRSSERAASAVRTPRATSDRVDRSWARSAGIDPKDLRSPISDLRSPRVQVAANFVPTAAVSSRNHVNALAKARNCLVRPSGRVGHHQPLLTAGCQFHGCRARGGAPCRAPCHAPRGVPCHAPCHAPRGVPCHAPIPFPVSARNHVLGCPGLCSRPLRPQSQMSRSKPEAWALW